MNIKVLQLSPSYKSKPILEYNIKIGTFDQVPAVFNRPGIYLQGEKCWFEVPDGRAFTYSKNMFQYDIDLLEVEEVPKRVIEALSKLRHTRYITKDQRKILHLYRDLTQHKEIDKRMYKWRKKRNEKNL